MTGDDRPSDRCAGGIMRAWRCNVCGELMPAGSPRIALQWPVTFVETRRVRPKRGKHYEETVTMTGSQLWAVHEGCVGPMRQQQRVG